MAIRAKRNRICETINVYDIATQVNSADQGEFWIKWPLV